MAGCVKRDKPPTRKYDCYQSGRTCSVGWKQSFFPVCPLWVTACSIYGTSGNTQLSASGSEGLRKKRNHLKPRKSSIVHGSHRELELIVLQMIFKSIGF